MLISKEDALKLAGSGATSVAPDLVKVVKVGADGKEQQPGLTDSFIERFGGADEERDYVGAAQTICLNALAVRAKSRGELAAQLKRRGIPLDVANEVLDRLERSKLINDLDFDRAWSKSRLSSKKISKRVLAQELRRKEVADDLIAIALDESVAKMNTKLPCNWVNAKRAVCRTMQRMCASDG